MADDRLMSRLAANGTLWMSPAAVGAMQDIDRRIKEGDESGWRGDPSMGLFYNQKLHRFEVWGIDVTGKEYLAAANDDLDINLVIKLRDGDPRKNDVFQRVIDNNLKIQREADLAEAERLAAMGDKLQWAIRQDFGAHLGGRKRLHAVSEFHKKETTSAA
jgi:hypothetical protein